MVCILAVLGLCVSTKQATANHKLSGRILLQVNQNGEAWYVNPDNEKRYYLGRPADAFALMRELGLGVSEENYNIFKNNSDKASANLAGKILLRVESNGEAYYVNPIGLKMHYLGRPADAFNVMRELGLGITDADLGKIEVEKGVEKSEQVEEESQEGQEQTEDNEEEESASREIHTYVGSGTYDFGEGDVLIDEINNKKFVQSGLKKQFPSEWLLFNIYELDSDVYIDKIQMYLEPEKLFTGYEEPFRLIYSYHAGKLPLYFYTFNGKNQDGTYNASFDFYLDDVLGDTAVGNKKILVLPVYFDDEYEVFDQYPLYRDTFLKPALEEIRAYLKVKQLEFMGEEIMTVDFTVADAVKLGKIKDYLLGEDGDNYITRRDMVNTETEFNHDDFNVVSFLFFTEQNPANTYSNTAIYNQAMIASHMSQITDFELINSTQIHQKRNFYTNGLLHEVLHVYGMSDEVGGGKYDYYEGAIYDGSQNLDDSLVDKISADSNIGTFQKINQEVAREIGWCDENNNNIFDANEYYVNKEE